MEVVKNLCLMFTDLTEDDIKILQDFTDKLPRIAELTDSDIFIDALTRNGIDSVVLAWARPHHRSLYRKSVVGELAYSGSEPGVFRTIKTGEFSRNIRGVSQEGVPIAQTVVPITNLDSGIIGVLIMERDISVEVQHEKELEFLSQTAEWLSNTLMNLSVSEARFEEWLGNGIFVLNKSARITYVNIYASEMYRNSCEREPLGGDFASLVPEAVNVNVLLDIMQEPVEKIFLDRTFLFQAYPLVTYGEVSGCVISLKDVSDLRKKERELSEKSAIISEIHHRVKNNLQNVAALLRLQIRRADSELTRDEFRTCMNRVLSIAMVHDILANRIDNEADFTELVQRILDLLVINYSNEENRINACVIGSSIQIPHRQAESLALIINELITNSFKHGISGLAENTGCVNVYIKERSKSIVMAVVDNGLGILNLEPFETGNRLGLQIVYSLISEQLQGTFSIKRYKGCTWSTVVVPKISAKEEL